MKFSIDYSDASFVNFLLFVWQLPQCLLALILISSLQANADEWRSVIPWRNEGTGMTVMSFKVPTKACWSLGPFIFVNDCADEALKRHESGHCVQSLILGPIYLLVVGLPSVLLLVTKRLIKKFGNKTDDELSKWYHSKYPECWADSLGCVTKHD